ncbi:hypothetical protein Bca52824_075416 [Brassica carinata]|uniref:Uncharacterized protein n=1 Tax=Brassica carinata TaxID=52824 RepID=A0A8X7PSW1_BRACI|nr:hypothetical protein Bca52824_075416 [Brassica carinata]
MAKKKPPKGKPPNRSTTHPGSASRSTSASKPRAVSPHAAGSDSATGKVDPGFPPVKDAQTTATVVDLAMEIENPNLENLATESNAVPRPTVPDTTVDANTGKETGTDLKPSQDRPTSNGSSPAELWKAGDKNKGATASSSVPPARSDIPSERSTPARANSPLLRTTPPSLPHRSKSLENRQRSVSPISHHAQRVNPHSQTLAVETNDLVEGRLVVDLTPYSSKNSISSGHVSDGSNFSGDEDPGDGDDKYIEVIS